MKGSWVRTPSGLLKREGHHNGVPPALCFAPASRLVSRPTHSAGRGIFEIIITYSPLHQEPSKAFPCSSNINKEGMFRSCATKYATQHFRDYGRPSRNAVRCVSSCSALRWRMHCGAMADAVHCVWEGTRERQEMQCGAWAHAVLCIGGCTAVRWPMQCTAFGRARGSVKKRSAVRG